MLRRFAFASLVVFLSACMPVGAPPPVIVPPVPKPVPVTTAAVTVLDPDGHPLPSAKVTLSPWSDGTIFIPCSFVDDASQRYACRTTATGGSTLHITADGFQPVHRDVTISSELGLFTLDRLHLDPRTLEGYDHPRGSLSNIFISELAPQCPEDPTTHIRCYTDRGQYVSSIARGLLFEANYRLYTDAQRQIIRDVLTGHRPDADGRLHHDNAYVMSLFCSGAPDYHGIYPPCTSNKKVSLDDALHELTDAGLAVKGQAMQDDEPDDLTTMPQFLSELQDWSLVTDVSPYWEHTEVSCAMVKLHRLLPNARLWWHNPTSADGPYPDPCFPADPYPGAGAVYSWLKTNASLYGVWKQVGDDTIDSVVGRIADMTASFSTGPRVCKVACGWPSGLHVVYFEDAQLVYGVFWGSGLTGQAALDWAGKVNRYVTVPLCEDPNTRAVLPTSGWCSTLDGGMNGGW